MLEQDLRRIMRPLYKDKIEAAREKRRRRRFADYNLPNTSQDWSDDQIHAYKGMRDGLGMDAHRAEQYVNSHTPASKPSGRANIFYPAMEPTAFEQDLTHQVGNRQRPLAFKPDDGPPVQFSSQSGHVLGDGEARKPRSAPVNARPIFNEAVQIGKQVHGSEQTQKLAQKNGHENGRRIDKARSVTERQGEKKKRGLTVKVGDEIFEFKDAFKAEELTKSHPTQQAMMQFRPMDFKMALVKGDDGKAYYVDSTSDKYKALQDARNIQRAEAINEASALVTATYPAAAPITAPLSAVSSAYLLASDPSYGRAVDVALSLSGARILKKLGLGQKSADRLNSILQVERGNLEKFKK